MSFMTSLRRLFGVEQKMSSLELFREVYGGRESSAGPVITWQRALEVSTVQACVRTITDGVCQPPFRLYRDDGSSRSVAKDHPLHEKIARRPNEWQTSFEFRETIMLHVLLTGNAYVFVNRVGSARAVRELIPIEPGRVTVKQEKDYSLTYTVRAATGEAQVFPQDAIWHLRGPSWNSWMGMEAVRMARDAIGLSISLEQGQADFQKGGAKTSGLMSVADKISPEKFEFLAKWLDKHQPGGERAGKPLVLDSGADYKTFTMSGVDQQLIETRKHQIEEICRAFRVWPIMVGHAGDQSPTFASAEQFFLAHVVHTLSPWYQRIEQSADANLLTYADRADGYYTKFNPNALMRGAAKDRAEFYAKALGAGNVKGWMTQNEVRALEDMDRSDDPQADELPQPPSGDPAPDNPAPVQA